VAYTIIHNRRSTTSAHDQRRTFARICAVSFIKTAQMHLGDRQDVLMMTVIA
jgi:hypothetical protein